MIRGKLRGFLHRSVYRYAIGVALITYALHANDSELSVSEKLVAGFEYFGALCLGVLLLLFATAIIQSRKMTPQMITFKEQNLVVEHQGELSFRDWDWIISARESPAFISLLVQKRPRFELYLPKSRLNENEYAVLRGWLVSHGKLPPSDEAV